ncbi:TPR and ankyrin repeat-containing protein 1 [Frankliniella fusca]|uniref:TPR and ankyrin repeat-containing protein 1 n=1 Tax=Frankliniella fusca TaxID=407009 RepID=A0AAE1HRK5_9NEOP|nr:TPR and ankyrin repeat-containing protein 1 [Frankliniella fusca]
MREFFAAASVTSMPLEKQGLDLSAGGCGGGPGGGPGGGGAPLSGSLTGTFSAGLHAALAPLGPLGPLSPLGALGSLSRSADGLLPSLNLSVNLPLSLHLPQAPPLSYHLKDFKEMFLASLIRGKQAHVQAPRRGVGAPLRSWPGPGAPRGGRVLPLLLAARPRPACPASARRAVPAASVLAVLDLTRHGARGSLRLAGCAERACRVPLSRRR